MTRTIRLVTLLFMGALLSSCLPDQIESDPPATFRLVEQESNTRSLLIGLSPVDENVVWASGTGGVVVRTTDGGTSWTAMVVPDADTLQFRDIHGVDSQTAYVLSAGTGTASRIYKTTDGGSTWELQFQNEGPEGFFDCMDFWDPMTGIAFSDQVDGEFILIRTDDGGAHWDRVPIDNVPDATEGEGSFAASGTCVQAVGKNIGYIGTGAGSAARLLKSVDRGINWTDFETPIHDGTSTSGISSLAWIDSSRGFAFGLELTGRDSTIHNAIKTADGGESWSRMTPPQLPDVYGGAVVPDSELPQLFVVGPKGIDYSSDAGLTWISRSKLDHWSVAFASSTTGWATGPGGRITKISLVVPGE